MEQVRRTTGTTGGLHASAGNVELKRQVNEFLSDLLDERERLIDARPKANGAALVVLGLVIEVGGLWYFVRLRAITAEASIGAVASRSYVPASHGLLARAGVPQTAPGERLQSIPLLFSCGLEADPGSTASADGNARESVGAAMRSNTFCRTLSLDGAHATHAYYTCRDKRLPGAGRACQSVSAKAVDTAVEHQIVAAVREEHIAVALAVQEEVQRHAARATAARAERLRQLEYQADLAAQRYYAVDPLNRTVAARLESDCNDCLRSVEQARSEHERLAAAGPGPANRRSSPADREPRTGLLPPLAGPADRSRRPQAHSRYRPRGRYPAAFAGPLPRADAVPRRCPPRSRGPVALRCRPAARSPTPARRPACHRQQLRGSRLRTQPTGLHGLPGATLLVCRRAADSVCQRTAVAHRAAARGGLSTGCGPTTKRVGARPSAHPVGRLQHTRPCLPIASTSPPDRMLMITPTNGIWGSRWSPLRPPRWRSQPLSTDTL